VQALQPLQPQLQSIVDCAGYGTFAACRVSWFQTSSVWGLAWGTAAEGLHLRVVGFYLARIDVLVFQRFGILYAERD
jgi:hypothetical protein